MSTTLAINNHEIIIKEINGKRVVTFNDIDVLHERPKGTAGRNFRSNRKHFMENIDFFEIVSSKFHSDEIRRFGINAPRGGFLITESGYSMLVKSFTDELSWTVQRHLVDSYFRIEKPTQLQLLPPKASLPPKYQYVDIPENPEAQKLIKKMSEFQTAMGVMLGFANRHCEVNNYINHVTSLKHLAFEMLSACQDFERVEFSLSDNKRTSSPKYSVKNINV